MGQKRKAAGRRRNLLIELGTEELPPKALKQLSNAFAMTFFDGLVTAGMVDNLPEKVKVYATPRRLAVWVQGVLPKQPDQEEERLGPGVQAAFNSEGHPTAAALGFAKSCGVPLSKLKKTQTQKGERLVHSQKVKGENLDSIVTDCLEESVKSLPIPKRMRWGDTENEFVRPVHWLLALYGSDIIKTGVLGLKSNRITVGHRFHCPGEIRIASADRYVNILKTTGYVIADYDVRQGMIEKQVNRLARKSDVIAVIDPGLLDEVTGLVEWPVALMGEYDQRFLKLPKEVLVSTMEDHQKYFFVVNQKSRPVASFITVSNIKSRSPKRVRQGNERVLRARLSDAEFFWNIDQKYPLMDRVKDLENVLFHFRLGSIYDKTCRIEKLAIRLAKDLGIDSEKTAMAARLCKADLVTDMVGEFPDLQGIIGRYYASNQNIEKSVAVAIDEHYMPRFAGDSISTSSFANCVAIADRVDSLIGIFACGEIPTGDKDPFGLRRASLAILRIMIEGKLNFDLKRLLQDSIAEYRKADLIDINTDQEIVDQVYGYMIDRLKGYFQGFGMGSDIYTAVQVCDPASPVDFFNRAKALDSFFTKRKTAAESLASANKRIANILAKSDLDVFPGFKTSLIRDQSEKELVNALDDLSKNVRTDFTNGHYDKGLQSLARLKKPVDDFFDQVMVMHENSQVRENRLALLNNIRQLFLGVADISKVRAGLSVKETPKK